MKRREMSPHTEASGATQTAPGLCACGGSGCQRKCRDMGNSARHDLKDGHPTTLERQAVHPGWLLAESAPTRATHLAEDTVRFSAFMQLLKTAGALDRAATDFLEDPATT